MAVGNEFEPSVQKGSTGPVLPGFDAGLWRALTKPSEQSRSEPNVADLRSDLKRKGHEKQL